jgi:hypothetical protein
MHNFVSDPEITVTCPLKCLPCGRKDVIDDFENLEDWEDDADDTERERTEAEALQPAAMAITPGASWERAPAMKNLKAKNPSGNRRAGPKAPEREGKAPESLRSHSAKPPTPLTIDLAALLHSRLAQATTGDVGDVIWSQLTQRSEAEQTLPSLQQPPPAKRGPIARPLEVEFLRPRGQQDKMLRCIFTTQPIGITFDDNECPLTVKTVSGGSTAHVQGVRRGMQIGRIMGIDATKSSMNPKDILKLVEDWCARLPDDQVRERAHYQWERARSGEP